MCRRASRWLLGTLSVLQLHFSQASLGTSAVDALQRTLGRLVSVEPHLRASAAGNQSESALGSRFNGNGRRSLVKNADPRVYLLADPNPVCLAAMSSGDYCPTPSGDEHVTDLYMGAQDRAMFALVNALRVSPRDYSAVYGGSLGCAASPLPPFRYSSPLQQASKQASRILATPGCPAAHDTCSSWCHLYNSCSYLDRIPTYSDAFQEVGENLAVGYPYVVKVISSWMSSDGHCASIFYAPYNHMGAGYWRDDSVANTYKHFWITDFAAMSEDVYAHNPIYSGSHVQLKTRGTPDYDTVRFLLTYYSVSEAVKATLMLDGGSYDLPLHLGSRAAGSFAADFGASDGGDCSKYYFQVEDAKGGVFRLPEKGHYLTAGVGACTRNYDDHDARLLEVDDAPASTWQLASGEAAASSDASLSPSYRYVGCRSLTARGMRGYALTSAAMNHALCDTHCRTQGFAYFGLSRDRCQCRASAPPADKAPLSGDEEEAACAHPCGGDKTQACGGPQALLWFQTI